MKQSPQQHLDFPHSWSAEILSALPMILPAHQFTYPLHVPGEEAAISRGALHLLVHTPQAGDFLATCALGFDSASVPTGIWACPHADDICAVAGGYAYIIRSTHPSQSLFLPLRPVVAVHPLPDHNLLLFAGFHSLLAFGRDGLLWQTARLTWEGLRITEISADTIHGFGWDLTTDRDVAFTVSLSTGHHTGGAFSSAK
jgi:hypothetical protein